MLRFSYGPFVMPSISSPDDLIRLCAVVFRTRPELLNDASGPDSVATWDSLATMDLLALIDERYGLSLSLFAAARLRSIGELRQALRAKGVAGV